MVHHYDAFFPITRVVSEPNPRVIGGSTVCGMCVSESTGSPRVKAFRLKADSYLRRQQLADFLQKNIVFH